MIPIRPLCNALLALPVLLAACGGRSSTASNDPEAGPPVECERFEAALERCYHRQTSFAEQPSLVTASAQARERVRQVCADNLQRLTAACGLVDPTPSVPGRAGGLLSAGR
jgi:hypothetical protein